MIKKQKKSIYIRIPEKACLQFAFQALGSGAIPVAPSFLFTVFAFKNIFKELGVARDAKAGDEQPQQSPGWSLVPKNSVLPALWPSAGQPNF